VTKVCPKHVELILEINKTVIVSSRWFLYYLTQLCGLWKGMGNFVLLSVECDGLWVSLC